MGIAGRPALLPLAVTNSLVVARLSYWASSNPVRLVCPTIYCSSTVRDWVYPNEIAQPPDAWGRRVLRVVDKSGESLIACEKPYAVYLPVQRTGQSQLMRRAR